MSITKKCCVIECKNKDLGADSGVIFYKFPTSKKLRQKWIDSCTLNEAGKSNDWEPEPNDVICNVHFVNGTRNPDDSHPCAVPQVFRSLRKGPKKKENFSIDLPDKSKYLKSGSKRSSLSTPKIKSASSVSLKNKRPPKTTGGLKKPLRLTVGRGRPRKQVEIPLEDQPSLENQNEDEQTGNEETEEEDDDDMDETDEDQIKVEEPVELSEAGRPVRNKRKKLDDDYEDSSSLRSLSVVIERSSGKKLKLSSGEIIIKEEPIDVDCDEPEITEESSSTKVATPLKSTKAASPLKIVKGATTQMKSNLLKTIKGANSLKASKMSSPNKLLKVQPKLLTAKSPVKFTKSVAPLKCKKCSVLEQKVFKLETLELSRNATVKCQRCPVIEQELKKVEEELEDIIESKMTKCQRCALIEQKCRRVENNLRKTQTDLSKLQHRLSAIDITEENFMKYKNRVKSYTGFPTYDFLMLVFEHVKPKLVQLNTKGINCFQMFILTIMKLKMNLPFWDLSYRFGAPANYVQNLFGNYINIMDSMLSHVILWPRANMEFRLQVLAGNLKQSFHCPYDKIEVATLTATDTSKLSEKEKSVRVCAALYHISQLVSSNHSQQLLRILNNKKGSLEEKSPDLPEAELSSNEVEVIPNGDETVADSDIFLEDFAQDAGLNSNDSLELEVKHLRKELENTSNRINTQFKFYTGLRNYQVFNNLHAYLKQHVAHISTEKLSHFQQLHLVLIRFKLNLEVEDLGYMFNVDVDYVVHICRLWIETMGRRLAAYIDWPGGVQDFESERKLLGTVKLKYQILWNPSYAPRNKQSGRDKEKIEISKLLRACAAIYNIDDIEVFKDGRKEIKSQVPDDDAPAKSNEELEETCKGLREEIYNLRKNVMSSIAVCLTEEKLQNNDAMVKFFTGFVSFEVLKYVFNQIIPDIKSEFKKAVSPFQQFILVLVRLKLNTNTQDLAYRFGLGHSNTFKLIQDWLSNVLHAQLTTHITWPDDDDDVEVFTDMLMNTYTYIKQVISPKVSESKRSEFEIFDTATLVCAGLYNIGEAAVIALKETSDFESFDEDW